MLARGFLERVVEGYDRVLQAGGAALALPEPHERDTKIGLRHSSFERHALAGSLLERLAGGYNCLLQPRGARSRALQALRGRRQGSTASSPIRAAPASA